MLYPQLHRLTPSRKALGAARGNYSGSKSLDTPSVEIDIHQTDTQYRVPNSFLRSFHLFISNAQSKAASSFFETLSYLTQLANIGNIPTNHKYLRANTLHLIENSVLKQYFFPILRKRGGTVVSIFLVSIF